MMTIGLCAKPYLERTVHCFLYTQPFEILLMKPFTVRAC